MNTVTRLAAIVALVLSLGGTPAQAAPAPKMIVCQNGSRLVLSTNSRTATCVYPTGAAKPSAAKLTKKKRVPVTVTKLVCGKGKYIAPVNEKGGARGTCKKGKVSKASKAWNVWEAAKIKPSKNTGPQVKALFRAIFNNPATKQCVYEDASELTKPGQSCKWDASIRGDGYGTSFVVVVLKGDGNDQLVMYADGDAFRDRIER